VIPALHDLSERAFAQHALHLIAIAKMVAVDHVVIASLVVISVIVAAAWSDNTVTRGVINNVVIQDLFAFVVGQERKLFADEFTLGDRGCRLRIFWKPVHVRQILFLSNGVAVSTTLHIGGHFYVRLGLVIIDGAHRRTLQGQRRFARRGSAHRARSRQA